MQYQNTLSPSESHQLRLKTIVTVSIWFILYETHIIWIHITIAQSQSLLHITYTSSKSHRITPHHITCWLLWGHNYNQKTTINIIISCVSYSGIVFVYIVRSQQFYSMCCLLFITTLIIETFNIILSPKFSKNLVWSFNLFF